MKLISRFKIYLGIQFFYDLVGCNHCSVVLLAFVVAHHPPVQLMQLLPGLAEYAVELLQHS
ncbi:hypothetical protein BDV10DRAFT_198586 [Aspergillus recurvatus]